MIAFKKLGRVPIPRGAVSGLVGKLESIDRYRLKDYDLIQRDIEDYPDSYYFEAIKSLSSQFYDLDSCIDESILIFKSIDDHNDHWPDTDRNGKSFKSLFFHTVIGGSGKLKIGTQSFRIERGDVFAMNPNINHSFVHDKGEYCITLSATGCSKDIRLQKENSFKLNTKSKGMKK